MEGRVATSLAAHDKSRRLPAATDMTMKGIASIRLRSWLLAAGAGCAVAGIGLNGDLRAQEPVPAGPPATAAETDPVSDPLTPGTDSNVAAATTPTPVVSHELAEAIRQLDDDQYAVRQAAQRQLTKIGAPALELTAQVAASGSLESATRAVNVLWKWADSTEKPLNRLALEKIAALVNRPVEAADAQRRLAVLREIAAIEAVVELGGHVDVDRSYGMIGGDGSPLHVVLGKEWKGGVDGLKHIADIRRATTVSLWSAPLGDEALPQLEELGGVRRLELYGLSMTPELVAKSREKLPNTIVEVRGPARLGIRGIDAIEIVPNSPAAKAGLVVHDRIIEFNGKPIDTGKPTEDFNALTGEIGKCKVGDTVEIKFRRGAETRTAKVTFDAWGEDVGPVPAQPDAPATAQGLFGPIPGPVPRRAMPRVQIERLPIGPPRPITPGPVDPALPR